MARFRAPANVQLRRAQLTLMLATLIPTVLLTAVGILMLAIGSGSAAIVAGVLVLAFCTSSLTGYILGSIYVSRGASIARFQNDFLSSVSHELRTPLTSILMFLETLRDERLTDPDEKAKCLDLLEREIRRLEGLVDRLISLSKIEARQHRFDRDEVMVKDIINDALTAFEAATLGMPVEVSVKVDDQRAIAGDREALVQAVANLLINAWKYTPDEDKEISLAASTSGDFVEISVSDNGPGIPKEEQKRIFEHFERGKGAIDSSKRGSGLGLAIVHAVVRAHKGSVDVSSRPGQGAEFRIRLPVFSQ